MNNDTDSAAPDPKGHDKGMTAGSDTDTDTETELRYVVVRNHEEQYSIWAADRALPPGWDSMGVSGSRQECLDHIDEVWTDIRPLSLRQALARQESQRG